MFVACSYKHNIYIYIYMCVCVCVCVCVCACVTALEKGTKINFYFLSCNLINIRYTKRVKVLYSFLSFCIIYQFDFCTIKLQERID